MSLNDNRQPVDDWFEYKRLVLAALEQAAKQNDLLNKKLGEIEIAVVTLQTKASMWGGVWGALGGVACSLVVALVIHSITGK